MGAKVKEGGEKVRLQTGRVLLLKCGKSIEQDYARFERSAEMFRDAQNRQMEQTNTKIAGFKDIIF